MSRRLSDGLIYFITGCRPVSPAFDYEGAADVDGDAALTGGGMPSLGGGGFSREEGVTARWLRPPHATVPAAPPKQVRCESRFIFSRVL